MARVDPELTITQHPTADLWLVTGQPRIAVRAVLRVADAEDIAEWSDRAGGWVVPSASVTDIEAASAICGVRCRTGRRAPKEAGGE